MPLTLDMPTELGAAGASSISCRRTASGGTDDPESVRQFIRWVETWAL